ncbi:MAG: DNA translocase FtsK 4TM domain-containing protein, partial [Sulfurimonas sp.]
MRESFFILILGIFIYLGFATILGDSALMGSYGAVFSSYNQKFFGYISYIYIFALIYPLYIFYKNQKTTTQKYEIVISFLLFLFSLLILQAIVIDTQMRGVAGSYIVDFLAPFIGIFGVLVLWLVITLVSFVITIDEKNFMSRFVSIFKNSNQKPIEDFLPAKKPQKAPIKQALKKEEPKEEPKTEDEPKSEDEPQDEPKNILSLASKLKEQKNAIVVDELEENAKLLEDLEKGEVEKPKNFKLPPLDFLQKPTQKSNTINEDELDAKIKFLLEKLSHFKIDGDVVRTYAGPVVSTFEFKPAANVKVSRILNLQDDLAMALSAETIRIQAPIPGKDVVGIEIPNETIDTIYLRELVDSKIFKEASSPLTIALGKDIVGKPFVTDLKKLPHLLIAGTTGSGKSVGINAMILSLLYKNSPDQLRLLMIDPKMLEFSIYNDIPHLLTPVITKAKQAIAALNNMVGEMERRYALMSETKTKNIESYNEKVKKEGGEHFPYIVIIIDELADLMMTSGKDVEHSIARLAQMARASGIHLVVATQRPSVDVVTGLIKANLPSRISYRVGQKVDSKIILDQMGAESL